jgi:hypothetical protein
MSLGLDERLSVIDRTEELLQEESLGRRNAGSASQPTNDPWTWPDIVTSAHLLALLRARNLADAGCSLAYAHDNSSCRLGRPES